VAPQSPLVRIALIGASGRMGQALLRAAPRFPQLIVTAAIASSESLSLGRDAGTVAGIGPLNLPVSADLSAGLAQADLALDFSRGDAVGANVAACRAARRPLLIGATGYGRDLEPAIDAAARDIAVLVAPNTSLGVAVLLELTRQAARVLPASFDIDVIDLHHRTKRDAPSGTARALGDAAAGARGLPPAPPGPPSGPRAAGQIGYAALRAGDHVGEHTVLFSGSGEELALRHRADDRSIFAQGALAAGIWLAQAAPGRYAMRDFLGFKTGT
jgi:4-hydroxy-tetrahydrodipicolinate reductase